MPKLCRICGRTNPEEAVYCHFDGVFLQSGQRLGPEDVAHAPFAQALYFPSGDPCQNFDQLALTCQKHWQETWNLLKDGMLAAFLGRLVGARLPAGMQPRTGKLVVATNAGSAEIAVTCEVPIVPFPDGVLAGCLLPREVAHKAKHAVDAAGELFFEGKVQAWYRANGWTYPVEGEPASGKAAVQQFLEALGLTKPPIVVVDTPAIGFQGAPGEKLQQNVQFHSDENRPIFAFGRSSAPWLHGAPH